MFAFIISVILLYLVYTFSNKVFKRSKRVKKTYKSKIDIEILETACDIEDVTTTIPLFLYNNASHLSSKNFKKDDAIPLESPFFINEGEIGIKYKNKILSLKKKGETISYSLGLLGYTIPELELVCLSDVEITEFNRCILNNYVIFSMFKKSCMEVVANYFNFIDEFVKKELELFKNKNIQTQLDLSNAVFDLLNITDTTHRKLIDNVCYKIIEPNKVIKKKHVYLNDLIYVHEGSINVIIMKSNDVNDTDSVRNYPFKSGSIFGYFSLFFNCYTSIEIRTTSKSKLSYMNYNLLRKIGFIEDNFNYSLLCKLNDFVHLTDICCEWKIYNPGVMFSKAQTTTEHAYFINEGKLKSKTSDYFSGMTIGNKECTTNLEFQESIFTQKSSDIISIPKNLIFMAFKIFPSFYEEFTRMLFVSDQEKVGKIVTILPSTKETNIGLFSKRLKSSIGRDCLLLSRKDVINILSDKAFDISEELRFMNYLYRLSRTNSVVMIYNENEYSRLLKYLTKFSDILLIVGDTFKRFYEFESCCNVEYVQIYEERRNIKDKLLGKKILNKFRDLKIRDLIFKEMLFKDFFVKKKQIYEDVDIRRIHHVLSPTKTILFCTKDFDRLARFILNKRIGLVLSGGGARGIAHIGVIQALEEEGIPIDIIGGTSMGAFIGALYARESDNSYVFKESKKFCKKGASWFHILLDITYPLCSIFSGKAINSSLQSIFKDEEIQNLWLEFFCISTNLSTNEEEIHRSGTLWRYLRASMGLCGYLPPICDSKGFLVDGGYMNNVPTDVMLDLGVSKVIAVDVGTILDNDYDDNEDSFNGFVGLVYKHFGTKKFITMEEMQYRLVFLSTENKIRELESNRDILLIKPDLGTNKTTDFHKFDEIVASGYQSGRKAIKEWRDNGIYDEYFNYSKNKKIRRRYSV